MSRSVPWRQKPTQLIVDMIEAVREYRLYLVSETGPFSFVFKDDAENKFKVTIGPTLKCSCGVVTKDHCIHTLFVLLKKFKVDENNPIVWQASYLDNELEGILQMKYSKKVKSSAPLVRRNHFKKEEEADSDFSEVGADETCPICYVQMSGQCFSTCGQCRNHMHTNCFKIWMRHKQESGDKVTCPLCRNPFHNPNSIVVRDLDKWAKKFTIHKGTKCAGCGLKNINGEIYHCLLCDQCNMCKHCYNHFEHPIHDRFLFKITNKEPWKAAPSRQGKKAPFKSEGTADTQLKEGSALELIQFFVNSLPSIKDHNSTLVTVNNLGLNIVGNEMKQKHVCKMCSELGNDLILRMNCQHTIHKECMTSMFISKDFYCPCGEVILPGYMSAMGLKQKKPPIDTKDKQKERSKEKEKGKGDTRFRQEKPTIEKGNYKGFRVRKSTIEKKPLPSDPFIQINNMPIRTRSVFRANI